MLDLKVDRVAVAARDAATLVLVRDGALGLEVFCVERNKASRFLGGAIVFPGGKVEEGDADAEWESLVTSPREPQASTAPFSDDPGHLRALAVAVCRESLEEAAIVPLAGESVAEVDDAALSALRGELEADRGALMRFLRVRGLRLDLASLHPFARWITPEAEARRFDARFFVAVAPVGQSGAHDAQETMASFWATPSEILRKFSAGEVQLAPPTHRILSLLGARRDAADALSLARASNLDPICPRLVPQGDTLALVLPGDPEHSVREARVAGGSRYVLRGERWLSEDAPR